jgi:hypothetical protein
MKLKKYFVCYVINDAFYDTVVDVPESSGKELVNSLRQAVHPDRPGDISDGMKPMRSSDCTILNFIELS